MPRPATRLPLAAEFFAHLDRPSWHAISSPELSRLLKVHVNTTWNWTIRGIGPEPEPPGTYARSGNRRLFSPAVVAEWLSIREGEPVEAWAWHKRCLAERRLFDNRDLDPGPEGVLAVILALDRLGLPQPRRWRPRSPSRLAGLEAVHTGPAAAG